MEIKPYDEVECVVCKHVIRFYEDEYKKPCNYCGTWIFDKARYRQNSRNNAKKQEEEEEKYKCWVCFDRGIVEYPVQHEMGVYNYVARYICPEGLNERDKKALVSNCSKIRKIVKEILQEW